jgi:hypothetical protein
MSNLTDSIKNNKGTTIAFGAILTSLIAILTYLNSSYASKDALDAHTDKLKTYEQSVVDHITEFESAIEENMLTVTSVENKLRQELKESMIQRLQWDKKLLLAKGDSNLSEYDRTVIMLIDTEISTLRGH